MPLYRLSRYLVAILFLVVVLAVFVYQSEADIAGLEQWLARYPTTGPLLFIALYTLLVPLFFPSILLAIMGGALFGPLWGTLYSEISAVLGALICFLVARYFSADWVERGIPANLKHLKQGVEKEGWRFVLMVRLIPWVPYALLNYALGVTGIRLFHLLGITALCVLPRVVAYSYIGHAGHMALVGKETVGELLLLVPVIIAVIFLPYLIIKVIRDMKESKE